MEGGADVLESFGDGRRVLCAGPPLTGKLEFLLDLVQGAAPLGRDALVVTTDTSASALLDRHPKAFEPGHAGIVDCTGTELPDRDLVLESVPSPADLTGIAVAVSRALKRIDGRSGGLYRPLVGVDSLVTLSLYAEFDRLFRFVHTLGGQVTDRDGLFLATLDSDGLDRQSTARIQSTVDGRIEFRNRTEYRVVGLGTSTGEWVQSPNGGSVDVDIGDGDTETAPSHSGTSVGSGDEHTDTGRLSSFVERILADGPTLTLCNVDDGTDTEVVDSHFGRLNVSVRRASLDVDAPQDVALLHDGDDLLAASPLPAVRSALDTVEPETESAAVLEAVPQELFAAEAADRRTLVRASRTIERLAASASGGDLHAGFQEVSRLIDDPETRAVYDRLDETDVTVHLYGESDADLPDWENVILHGLADPELADAWFVVFEGPDSAAGRGGALVTLEGEPGAYDGFWSYDPEIVSETCSFVESTYLD